MSHHESIHAPDTRHTIHVVTEGDPGLVRQAHEHGVVAPAAERMAGVVQDTWERDRKALLELPNNTTGLDMQLVEDWRWEHGAPDTPILALEPSARDEVRRVFGESADAQGAFLGTVDVAFVWRDAEFEADNGPGVIESFMIHELTHADARFEIRVTQGAKRRFIRLGGAPVGMLLTGKEPLRAGPIVLREEDEVLVGQALDEGIAEYERGQFVADKLGKPRGFGAAVLEADKPEALIDKYTFIGRGPNGKKFVATTPGGPYAVVLERLVEQDPALRDTLQRRHTTEGMRELAIRMNKIVPDIYPMFRDLDESTAQDYSAAKYAKVLDTYVRAHLRAEAVQSKR